VALNATAGTAPASRWLKRFRPAAVGSRLLLCLPYAGGGASLFRPWAIDAAQGIEVCAFQLPGRENRIREAPLQDMGILVDNLCAVISAEVDEDFSMFGHSLGALVCFETVCELRRRGARLPEHLFVSACEAPHTRRSKDRSGHLDDAAFLERLRQLGGVSEQVLAHREILALLLPMLRADFRLAETYRFRHDDPLPIPVTAVAGRDDRLASPADLARWRELAGAGFELVTVPGDHFYVSSHHLDLLSLITDRILASRVDVSQP
jgi:medium-chain acyl-[acyl-carrier-protein] hydrolase